MIPGIGHIALTGAQVEEIKQKMEERMKQEEVVYGTAPRDLIYKMIHADLDLEHAKSTLDAAQKNRDQVWQEIYDHIEDPEIAHKARFEDFGISIDRRNGNLTASVDEHEVLHEVLGELVIGEGGVLAQIFGEDAVAKVRGEDEQKTKSSPDYQR
jgi:hypothetical protein